MAESMVADTQGGPSIGGVTPEPAAPAGGNETLPVPVRPDGVAPSTQDTRPNAIPHDRAEEMARRREAKAYERARAEMAKEFETLRTSMSKSSDDIKAGIAESFLRSLGYDPNPKKPDYVERAQMEEMLKGQAQQFQKALEVRADYEAANADLERGRAKYQEFFDFDPDFEKRVIALWSAHDKVPMGRVIEDEVKRLTAFYDKRNAKYVAQKAVDAKTAPVSPGGGQQTSVPKRDLRTKQGLDSAVDEFLDKRGYSK